MELVGKHLSSLDVDGHDDYSVGIRLKALGIAIDKRLVVEAFVEHELDVNVEVTAHLHGLLQSLLHFLPIGFRLVLWNERDENV